MRLRGLRVCVLLTMLSAKLGAECAPPPPTCQALSQSTIVFYGEVQQATLRERQGLPRGEASTDAYQDVQFLVIAAHKGVEARTFSGTFIANSYNSTFQIGRRYLVYAVLRSGAYDIGCSRTREVAADNLAVALKENAELNVCAARSRGAR